MADIDFITTVFNLSPSQIESFNCYVSDHVMYFRITLTNNHPSCPHCGGSSVVKDYYTHEYNHLDIAGIPSRIIWKRRRYKCKDCRKTFSEQNVFGPEHFHSTYAVLNQIAIDLRNPHKTFQDIAADRHVSATMVSLYADSFLIWPSMVVPSSVSLSITTEDVSMTFFPADPRFIFQDTSA